MIQSWLLLVPRWHWKVVGQKSQSCSCAVDLQWCVKCSWQWSNKHNFIQLMNSYSKLNTENGIELFWIETIEKEQQHFANAFVSHAIGKGKGQQCNGFPFLEDQSTKKIPKRIKPSKEYKYLFYFFRNWCVAMLTCCECAIVSWCRLLGSRLLLDTLCHHLPPPNHHISTCHSSAWYDLGQESSWGKLM